MKQRFCCERNFHTMVKINETSAEIKQETQLCQVKLLFLFKFIPFSYKIELG